MTHSLHLRVLSNPPSTPRHQGFPMCEVRLQITKRIVFTVAGSSLGFHPSREAGSSAGLMAAGSSQQPGALPGPSTPALPDLHRRLSEQELRLAALQHSCTQASRWSEFRCCAILTWGHIARYRNCQLLAVKCFARALARRCRRATSITNDGTTNILGV